MQEMPSVLFGVGNFWRDQSEPAKVVLSVLSSLCNVLEVSDREEPVTCCVGV